MLLNRVQYVEIKTYIIFFKINHKKMTLRKILLMPFDCW